MRLFVLLSVCLSLSACGNGCSSRCRPSWTWYVHRTCSQYPALLSSLRPLRLCACGLCRPCRGADREHGRGCGAVYRTRALPGALRHGQQRVCAHATRRRRATSEVRLRIVVVPVHCPCRLCAVLTVHDRRHPCVNCHGMCRVRQSVVSLRLCFIFCGVS
jgi:hypothetical protein